MPEMKRIVIFDADENEVELPTKFEVCSNCQGRGKSSAYLGAITESDWRDWDYEERERYFEGGYDKICESCEGTGLVTVIDESKLTKELLKLWNEYCEEVNYARRIEEAERRMGA